jgi:hypothetical protein
VRGSDARSRVFAFLSKQGKKGCTDEECALALNMNRATQRARRVELQRRGLVRDTGNTRVLRSGRYGAVWMVVK